MRILLFSGSHARHIYFLQAILKNFDIAGTVCMQREDVLPKADPMWDTHHQLLFNKHFQERYDTETETYGNLTDSIYNDVAPTLYISPEELNSIKTLNFVKKVNADVCIIFGTDLILSPVIEHLPKWKLNLHLGLSPWYRGSATLFWPFYFLQPQYAGATIHQIIPAADAGDIVQHIVPELKYGMGIHQVAAQVVIESRKAIIQILNQLEQDGDLPLSKQKSGGKLFLSRDFEPAHLKLIYDTFQNKIVDAWLDGLLGTRTPKLISIT